jgi:hypothetical protein
MSVLGGVKAIMPSQGLRDEGTKRAQAVHARSFLGASWIGKALQWLEKARGTLDFAFAAGRRDWAAANRRIAHLRERLVTEYAWERPLLATQG